MTGRKFSGLTTLAQVFQVNGTVGQGLNKPAFRSPCTWLVNILWAQVPSYRIGDYNVKKRGLEAP